MCQRYVERQMKKDFFKAVLLGLSVMLVLMGSADAARLGGGRSFGRAPSAPLQRQATPIQRPAQSPAPSVPATPNRFGGLFGGLAAGLGLGYLFSHFGLGEATASLVAGLLIAALIGCVMVLVMRRLLPNLSRSAQNSAPRSVESAFNPASNAFAGVGMESEPFHSTLPPGFDEYAFLANAKQYFISLQQAWDRGDLVMLQEFTTPTMFSTIQQDLAGRSDSLNQTDVLTLDARLLGIETAGDGYFCSVQFSGLIREQVDAPANHFSETWNLTKPINGPGGWVLAGIQQLV